LNNARIRKKIMKQNKFIIFIFTSIALLLSACQKETSDVFLPDSGQLLGADTNWVTAINSSMPVSLLKADLAIPTHIDTIDIDNNTSYLNAASGLQCTFQPNCLTDSNNNPIKGDITAESLLLQNKGDLVRLNMSTIANGKVIGSAGMFFIKLKKDGAGVKLSPQAKINIQYRDTQNIPSIKLFYGTAGSLGILNWYVNNDSVNNITASNNGYEINTNRLGWINAGYPIEANPLENINISINLAKHFTNANTVAWLVFKNSRSVVNLNGDPVGKKFSCTNLPHNQEATILVLSRQVDDYYLGSKEIISTAGSGNLLSVAITPVKVSLDVLKQYLNSL